MSNTVPTAPGHYIYRGELTGCMQLITILKGNDGLYNVSGARTHFSRWRGTWSDELTFTS